jgi:crotonobetainyl-CoA:carnitine CoA-transferase CaiB-like acyl-CoA transferase
VWGAFPTKDGWICLAGVDDRRWPRFCEIMGLQHLLDDPECDNLTRNFYGDKIEKILEESFVVKTTEEWMTALTDADILATPVRQYQDILNSEQAQENAYITWMEHPQAGRIKVVGNPITMSETPVCLPGSAPELGQHTEEVLLEIGYSWEEIAKLREKGAL